MASTQSKGKGKSKEAAKPLPLGLQPYHVFYLAGLSALVIVGTAYSVVYSTHVYNVSLSASVTQHPLRSALESNPLSQAPLAESARLPATIFADRRNWINRIFIKRAWGWTGLAFAAQALTLRAAPSSPTSPSSAKGKEKERQSSSSRGGNNEEAMARAEATIYSPLSRSTFRFLVATLLWGESTSQIKGSAS